MKDLMKPQKRLAKLFILLLVLGLAGLAVFTVQAGSPISIDREPLDYIAYPPAEMTNNAPALTSLAAMYAPMDMRESWSQSVCVGMTKGGCEYFKANQADEVWDENFGNIGSSTGGISNITVIDGDHEVWTAATSIFTTGPNGKHSTEQTFDVYVLVERGSDQRWYLDRVLIGPGIAVETTK